MLSTEAPKVIHPEDREIIERLAKLQAMSSRVRAPRIMLSQLVPVFEIIRQKHAADLHQRLANFGLCCP